MAKRQTGKRSVKRAFKKRRTIRKFRKTMRRYMQSGGDAMMMMKLLFIAFAAILASSPKLLFLIQVISSSAKENVINFLKKLGEAYSNDTSLPQETRNKINAIITRLTDKINKATENPRVVVQPLDLRQINNEVSQTNETVSPDDGNTDLIDKLKNVFLLKVELYKTKLNTLLDGKIQSIKQKYGLDDTDVADIKFLKSVVINDVLGKKDELFGSITKNITFTRNMAAAVASAAAAKMKDKVDTVLQQNSKLAAAVSAVKDKGTAAASEAASKFTGKVGTFLQQNQTAAAAVSAVKDNGKQFFGDATDKFKTGLGNYLNSSPRAASALTNLTSGIGWGKK